MQLCIVCNELQKEELFGAGIENDEKIVWVNSIQELIKHQDADAFVDLLFENVTERVSLLKSLLPKLVIINSVTDTLLETDLAFVRIAGWPTFLKAALIEASCLNNNFKSSAEQVFGLLNKKVQWLSDEPGFITPRVISAIINEAYFALADGVSTVEEIDTAMMLGTAYPYGPFAWGSEIGLQNIVTLLKKLSRQQKRYLPSELLVQETDQSI
jgi:3-hydroxybutyryl-CoA dehydrogenase